jgi:hypothetical protein
MRKKLKQYWQKLKKSKTINMMKKLVLLFALAFWAFTISLMLAPESQAQIIKSKKIKTESAQFVTSVGNFNLIFQDTQGQMDVHETMKRINPDHNPTLAIIKDEDSGVWRLAVTLEESSRMPDDVSTIFASYDKVIPYKRTGYN